MTLHRPQQIPFNQTTKNLEIWIKTLTPVKKQLASQLHFLQNHTIQAKRPS